MIYLADAGKGATNVLFKLSDRLAYGDKIGHLLLFGPLAFGVNVALKFKRICLGNLGSIYLGTLLVACFVLTEELSQHFFPTRHVELLDLLADSIGIALFTWFSSLIDNKIQQRKYAAALHHPVSP
jgi:VanZ family protein